MSDARGTVKHRDSPYFGLDYYEEKYGAWFFGRETEGDKVITNLRAARLTLLHAESGVGKSSLLRAGVAWRLRKLAADNLARRGTARSVPVVFSSWKDDPVPQLVDSIGKAIKPYLGEYPEPELPIDRLDAAIGVASRAVNANLFLMLDQFEEYFLYSGGEPTPERFADEFAACINRTDLRANFLISIREDAYAGLGDLFKGRIANVYGNYLHVDYLDRPSAEEAIRRPLSVYNSQPDVSEPVRIQDELVQAVLDEVRAYGGGRDMDPGRPAVANGSAARVSTPLLQLVMDTVWRREHAEGSNELRLSTLQNLRGVRMIVNTHLGKALNDLGSGGRQTAIDLLDHLVTPSGGKIAESVPDLAKRTGHSEEQVGSVLKELDDSRIVRPVPAPPGQDPVRFRRYEIFHDVLAPAINHTIAAREERRRARRFRRLAALAVGLLIVTLALVLVFISLYNSSVNEKLTAESRELAADAIVNSSRDPELGVLLALQALHLQYTDQAEESLRSALPGLQAVRTFQDGTTVSSAVFDPVDANEVASADRHGMASMWDVKTGRRLMGMSMGGFNVTGGALAVTFNPAGTQLGVGFAGGQVALFDTTNGRKLQSAQVPGSPAVNDVEFLGSKAALAIATQHSLDVWLPRNKSKCCYVLSRQPAGTIAVDPQNPLEFAVTTAVGTDIWNLSSSRARQQRIPEGLWTTNDTAFSPDGRQILTADSDGTVRVYDLGSVHPVMTLDAGEVDATSAAFSPDGRQIVVGYSSGEARVWDTSTRLELTLLAGNAASVDMVRFSHNGQEVVTASNDGTIRVWHTQPRELQGEFASSYSGGQPNPVEGAQYLSERRIISLDGSGSLHVFTPAGALLAVIHPRGTTVDSAAWNRSGTKIVTADADGSVELWDASGPDYAQIVLPSPIRLNAPVHDVEMSPDGFRITIVSTRNYYAVQVRSTSTGQLLRTLAAQNSVSTVAISPNGRQIVAGDYNGQVETWSATGHRRVLGKPGPQISDVEFNRGGGEFVTSSDSGTLTVWTARDDRPRRSIAACPSLSTASPSPDGSEIVVACGDGSAQVFDAATGEQLTALPAANAGTVSSAGFSPDGKSIITGVERAGNWCRADLELRAR